MKRISLSQGQFAIVDDENYKWLMQWKWHACWNKCTKSFYAMRNAKKQNGKKHIVFMAREILGLKCGDKREADHINHNTLDNRQSELRIVTHQQNSFNMKNAKGYEWSNSDEKYRAYIKLNGRKIHLGYFLTAKEARNAYLVAKKKYHRLQGENNANTNDSEQCRRG